MFSMKRMRYDIPTTVLSLLYIFVGALLALCLLTFHKHSIVYKIRDRLAARDSAVMPITSSSRKAGESEENVTDLHGSLDALRNELYGLATDLLAFLSPRLAVSSVFVGTGVVLMHFSGMQAMRCDDVDTIVNPIMAGLALPIAWIGAAVILFFLYHMHGFKRRFVASVVIGVAVNLVHYFGFFAGTFYAVPAALTNSSLAVGAEVACVVVSLLSSVARFVFMGMIAANAD
jgi:NO-binding membrane sensor protein with MHYT domain